MGLYVEPSEPLRKLDARSTRYRYDIEALAWSRLDEPGDYVTRDLLRAFDVDVAKLEADPAAMDAFQWAWGLSCAEGIGVVERAALGFVERERANVGATRSLQLFEEEELKHIETFDRMATHQRASRPEWTADFDRAFEGTRFGLVEFLDPKPGSRSAAADPWRRHYTFWVAAIFLEEGSIYLSDKLDESPDIQPAWSSVMRAHRTEEIQHVATDTAHLQSMPPSEEHERSVRALQGGLVYQFSRALYFEAPILFVQGRFPELGPLRHPAAATSAPFFRDLLGAPQFRRTRQFAWLEHSPPYWARPRP